MTMDIELNVNGKRVNAAVSPRTHLADFLREQLLLTGTHIGCEHGVCGACTVEINGEIARSCITFAVACDGADIRTIEGFDDDTLMLHMRKAFTEEHALQCGYCTPGMLVAARDLVRRKTGLSRAEIRSEMSGNLCRCTGYVGIVNAVERVMREYSAPTCALPITARVWLGPAPGPVVASAERNRGPAAPMPAAAAPRPMTLPVHGQKPGPVRVSVGIISQLGGRTQFVQSFILDQPREAVWKLMSSPAAIAQCMPGLSLDALRDDNHLTGRLEVNIGPIAASFGGAGTMQTIAAEHRQIIEGAGTDRRSGSNVSGGVDYSLHAVTDATGKAATRVEVTISYALTGPLAQFGRAGIIRDLARRMGEALAQNLDSQLRNPGGVMPVAQVKGLSLLFGLLLDRCRALMTCLVGTDK